MEACISKIQITLKTIFFFFLAAKLALIELIWLQNLTSKNGIDLFIVFIYLSHSEYPCNFLQHF